MKAATEIREKEHAVFVAEQKEFSTVIDMLQRAIAVLEKELGNGASMMQIKSATSLEQALTVTVKADDDSETGAPEAAVYGSHSGISTCSSKGAAEE